MKTKLLVAWEEESSTTTRLTIDDLATLVSKIPDSDLPMFFGKVKENLSIIGTNERRAIMEKLLK